MNFTVKELIQANNAPPNNGFRFLLGNPHATFRGVSIDTRTLQKDDLFFAIPGPHHDGHDHLEEAVRKGAAGVVVQTLDERVRFEPEAAPAIFQTPHSIEALQQWARYLRSRSRATVIGITGTNGKTTTKEMTAAILSRMGNTLSTRGNLNNHLGLPLTLSRLQPDHYFAVLEMGASREGDIALLTDIAGPKIGLITNIGKAHLLGLGTPEGVLKEKRVLLDRLPVDGTAVLNLEDPLISAMANELKCRKIFFGLTSQAEVRAESIREEETAVRFKLNVRGQIAEVRLGVPGRFQVLNALAAAAIAHVAGASMEQLASGLASFRPVAMRMQVLTHPSGALLINDAYNANPSSVRSSVASFCNGYAQRSRWLVLGDMRELGSGAAVEHRELGVWLATQPLERILLYGRDMRFTLDGLAVQPSPSLQVNRYRKKRQLIADLQNSLTDKQVVLFKGSRAMRLEDIVNALLPS